MYMPNFNKFKYMVGIFGTQLKQHHENAARPLTQRISTRPNLWCYLTLQKEMLAIITHTSMSKPTKYIETTVAFEFAGIKSGRLQDVGNTVCAKNETRIILNVLYNLSLLQWNLACDILMTLAIKRIHKLSPHLSYASTLPDLTLKLKRNIDEPKHWHLELYSSGHHRQSHWPVANTAACMCKGKRRHYEQSHNRLYSEPLTRHIGSDRATHTIERKTT